MNNFLYKLLILLFCGSFTFVAAENEDKEHLFVKLATESRLMPLYLADIYIENASFDEAYLKTLEKVLHFDLSHNGMTFTVKHTGNRDAVSKAGSFDNLGKAADWKALDVYYVIKVRVKDRKLDARMFSVNGNTVKTAEGLALTGALNKDRRTLHQLADMIHKALFNTDGIATTRFLYSVKTKSADGKHISEIWEADYDGHNAQQITKSGEFSISPVYVPPKAGYTPGSFFYVSYKTGQSKIYMASLTEGEGYRFTLLKGNQLMPSISRQRNKVVFISDYTGNPDVFVQEFSPESGAIGKPQQVFAAKHATQGSPVFSPDGNRIAFVSNKDGSPRIYVMAIPAPGAGSKDIQVSLVTKHNKESSAPSWSPDGSKLAYCSMAQGVRQIWVYDFDKRMEYQVTQGAGNKENPTWAPNNLHLIFNSTGGQGSELYLVNLNQPESKKISSGSGEKHFPSWQPQVK